ncbi:MAG: DUF2993 domain-containing protein [Cyanobacteriota bacterium]|nr:DUF2993 domain-containing protein [Cyanobacteriota bacterium]
MPSAANADRPSGPFLALLRKSLELWLRSQCEGVEELELQLEGSISQLLQGSVQGVRLRAKRAVFQSLSLEAVDLASEPIRLKLPGVLRGAPPQLEQPFLVRGSVVFSAEGLSRSLASPAWQGFADDLCRQLLGGGALGEVGLEDGRLILRARSPQGEELEVLDTRMELTPSGLELCPLKGGQSYPIPLDGAIQLERAEVRQGWLEFAGVARVQP